MRSSRRALLCFAACGCAAGAAPAPRMPERFSAKFDEVMYTYSAGAPGGIGRLFGNASGSWTYDAPSARWVYEHGDGGFFSEFCSANDPSKQRCWIHFHASESMKVLYGNGTCCSLCAAEEGCSFLRPDWLTFGNYTPAPQPATVVDGAKCIGWGRPGAVTSVDAWFETEDGTPCLYFERFNISSMGVIHHNVTFRRATYSTAAVEDAVWRLPESCAATCPRHGYPPKLAAALQGAAVPERNAIVV